MNRLRSSVSFDADTAAASITGRWYLPVLTVAAALAGTLLYLPTLSNPFIYDDYHLIVENPYLGALSDYWNLLLRDVTRPVVTASYVLDTAIWGREPYGYRLTNILLHAINVLLVFRLALVASEDRLRQRERYRDRAVSPPLVAFATASLFAVHPMMTQAVTYISGRSEVAYCAIFLAAFLSGRRWMLTGGKRWLFACSWLWALGLLTKESAAMLPFVMMVYGWLVLDTSTSEQRARLYRLGLPLIGLTLLAVLGRLAVLHFVEYQSAGIDGRFGLVAVDAFWRYVALFALRKDQAVFHAMPMPEQTSYLALTAAVVGFVALPLAAWGLRRIHSVMSFGAAWFLMLLAPSGALFALGVGEPLAEHRAYVAAAGLFMVWGSAFDLMWENATNRALRAFVVVIGVLFLSTLSLRTLERNEIWSNPVTLAREAVALAPDHWIPRMLLGDAYRHAGRCDDAIPEYQKVVAMRPLEKKANLNLVVCLIKLQKLDEAEAVMVKLDEGDPASLDSIMTLGVLAALRQDPAKAQGYFQSAVDRHPNLEDAHRMLAFTSGTLTESKHRQLCDELRTFSESFDVGACMGWRNRRKPV